MKEFKRPLKHRLVAVRKTLLKKPADHLDVSKGIEENKSSLDGSQQECDLNEYQAFAREQLYGLALSAFGSLEDSASEAEVNASVVRAQVGEASGNELSRLAGGTWQICGGGLVFIKEPIEDASTDANPVGDPATAARYGLSVEQWLAFSRRARRMGGIVR